LPPEQGRDPASPYYIVAVQRPTQRFHTAWGESRRSKDRLDTSLPRC